jgi:hypothetical protein
MADDRRAHRRYALRVPVLLYLGAGQAPTDASLFDVSEGGAFFTTPTPPPHGANAYMRFGERGGSHSEATGYVLRTMPFGGVTGVAVQFGHVNAPFLDFLRVIDATLEATRIDLFTDLTGFEIFIG